MMEQKNLIVAIALSLAIVLGFQYFIELPRMRAEQAAKQAAALTEAAQPSPAAKPAGEAIELPSAGGVKAAAETPATADRSGIIAGGSRVKIVTPRVSGSIDLIGGRLDDFTLTSYRQTVDPTSPNITLLNPAGLSDAYFAEFGWLAGDTTTAIPTAETKWTADHTTLTPDQPVTLTWNNGAGLTFIRHYAIDTNFMVTVQQRVESKAAEPVKLFPYALASRTGTPQTLGYFILHEGFVGVLNGTLREHKYKDVESEQEKTDDSVGGWIGLTDKYFLVALIPDQQASVKTRFMHKKAGTSDKFQLDYLGEGQTLAPGASIESTNRLFAGAKEVKLLEAYEKQLGITRFDYAVDWGWFFFLTRPFFHLLDLIYGMVGNFGIAILIMTVLVKAAFYPLATRSYIMMSKMKRLTPKINELKEKYGDDKARINQEMMGLYKTEKVNPVSGCLPILLQIPVFFSLYKVLFVTIEMRHAPFYGWIKDLSSPDPTTVFNLFGLIPWTPPHFLMFGAWPLIMGVTMLIQQRLNPQPSDPIQAKIFTYMPVVFTIMLAQFPSGLVIYWAWNNTLSVIQQYSIMRRHGVK